MPANTTSLVDRRPVPHRGMPPFDQSGPPVSFFEFWPQRTFYAPMFLYWLWLTAKHGGRFTLPTLANPLFPMGGWVGESKAAVFALSGAHARRFIAPWAVFDNREGVTAADALSAAMRAGLSFPFVAKPDVGCRGVGVRRIGDATELARYLAGFPKDRRIVFQRLVDEEAEAGVFYVRKPGAKRGRIVSITLKYFPYVYGDGRSTLRELIENDRRAGPLRHIYLPRHWIGSTWSSPGASPSGSPSRAATAEARSFATATPISPRR
jgi:hypothetical protein